MGSITDKINDLISSFEDLEDNDIEYYNRPENRAKLGCYITLIEYVKKQKEINGNNIRN